MTKIYKPEIFVAHNSGNKVYIDDPSDNEYNIRDIGHSLSNSCRFNGHLDSFYSVAQHSYYVSQMCIKYAPGQELEGLMHDAAESVMTDIPRPVKYYIEGASEFDEKMSKDIFKKFGLKWPMSKELKLIDDRMLKTEATQLLKNVDISQWAPYWQSVEPFDFKITPWRPEFAKEMFLDRYTHLWTTRVMDKDELKDSPEVTNVPELV